MTGGHWNCHRAGKWREWLLPRRSTGRVWDYLWTGARSSRSRGRGHVHHGWQQTLCRERILYVRTDLPVLLFATSTGTSWGRERCDRTPIRVTSHRSTRSGGSCRATPRRARSTAGSPRSARRGGRDGHRRIHRNESRFQFDAGRYRERTAGLAASPEEDPSPPPSGGSGGMPDPCCKGVRNHSRKEIEEGKPQQDKEDLVK